MSATTFGYIVTMESGETFEVVGDQRDIAAFELEPFGLPFYQVGVKPFTFARYLAWRSGKRARLHALSWEEFSDQCISVESTDEGDAESEDPGQPVASAGT